MGGLHPVVAVYATFLNRAFDQVLMDVALHKCGVTFVLDRAGVTGDDGASHNGMWDMSILQVVPGLRLAAPRDAARLRELLNEAVEVDDAPTVVRFPKGPAVRHRGASTGRRLDVLVRTGTKDVLLVGIGSMAATVGGRGRPAGGPGLRCHRGRPALGQAGRPGPGRPRPRAPVGGHRRGQRRIGGCGSRCCCRRSTTPGETPVRLHGIPQGFLDHAKRGVILERIGLTAQALARSIVEDVTALDSGETLVPVDGS